MGDLTRNFDRREFRCRGTNCCQHSAPISMDLVWSLEEWRDLVNDYLQLPEPKSLGMTVNCGFRCVKHNRSLVDPKTGRRLSKDDSTHPLSLAADIRNPNFRKIHADTGILFNYKIWVCFLLKVPCFKEGGIGTYRNFAHVDVRATGLARWGWYPVPGLGRG